jgi:Raf kinase inhibitor-like YbhB/YbcL family protein
MATSSSCGALAIQRVRPREAGRLTLASEAIGVEGGIGDAYSAYHDNLSPPLMWTGMPGAESFALVLEDPDAPTERPFLHWAIWNIPGKLGGLPMDIPKRARLDDTPGLTGAVQGLNGRERPGYLGPRPPAGEGPHRYHFQLFALDQRLDLSATAPLEDLVQALKANTIASCELIGIYEQEAPGERAAESRSYTQAEHRAGRGGWDLEDIDRDAPHDQDRTVRPGR